ncbi:hypothetical protein [Actinocrispum sp. NPDC049592]|uniref:hypothetical protein n=1 Tax=Actinocrispum sp. NPDC049592 TaxID=3154835 RepID=UPI00342D94C9
MSKAPDPAQTRFEQYLYELGYEFDYEPDLGNGKRPDYLVSAHRHELVCEVKSFDTAGAFGTAQVGTLSQEDVLAPIRKQIGKASEQLKGIPSRPLVVVLANPRACPVPLDPFSVMAAMYGDVEVEIPVSDEGVGGDATWTTGYNRKLRVVDPETGEQVGGHHEYISAVIVLRHEDLAFRGWARRWKELNRGSSSDGTNETAAFLKAASGEGVPHSEDVFLDIFETVSDQAVPLPREVFNGPHDRRWVPNDTRTALVPLT